MQLKERFETLTKNFADSNLLHACWNEIEQNHSEKGRFYHNLSHLESLFTELDEIQDDLEDWTVISWSVFFHDIIYNVKKQNNEELSAEKAVEWLSKMELSPEQIIRCKNHIKATKSHDISTDSDTNLFTDADLSILGKEWPIYKKYIEAIRKEYRIYPNLIYKPARKKILKHFLEMPALYKSTYFKAKYEEQARENIAREIELL